MRKLKSRALIDRSKSHSQYMYMAELVHLTMQYSLNWLPFINIGVVACFDSWNYSVQVTLAEYDEINYISSKSRPPDEELNFSTYPSMRVWGEQPWKHSTVKVILKALQTPFISSLYSTHSV